MSKARVGCLGKCLEEGRVICKLIVLVSELCCFSDCLIIDYETIVLIQLVIWVNTRLSLYLSHFEDCFDHLSSQKLPWLWFEWFDDHLLSTVYGSGSHLLQKINNVLVYEAFFIIDTDIETHGPVTTCYRIIFVHREHLLSMIYHQPASTDCRDHWNPQT